MAQIFQILHFCYLLIIQDVSISALQTEPIEHKLHSFPTRRSLWIFYTFLVLNGSFIRSCFEWIFYTFLVLNGSFIRFFF
jgi:hypothetical protein